MEWSTGEEGGIRVVSGVEYRCGDRDKSGKLSCGSPE